MRYHVETVIDIPRHEVVELFDDPEHTKRWNTWHEDLDEVEHLTGEPGAVGAKSRLKFGKTEMTETIIERDLPDRISRTYETDTFYNVEDNRFSELPGDRTHWRLDNEFQFSGFLMKAMGALMPWAFKSETLKRTRRFKEFAENEWRRKTVTASDSPAP